MQRRAAALVLAIALAGLRLGYALAAAEVVRAQRAVKPLWSVSAAARGGGLAPLLGSERLAPSRAEVRAARLGLVDLRVALDYRVHPSSENAILDEIGDGRSFCEALLGRGIAVRDCAPFGLREYFRIGVGARPKCRRLAAPSLEARRQGPKGTADAR